MTDRWVSKFIGGKCHIKYCENVAEHKVGEEIPQDDPFAHRHNLTTYVCRDHFKWIFGEAGTSLVSETRQAIIENKERSE